MALTGATLVWFYVWILLPVAKIFDFVIKKIIRVVYSLIGDIIGPLGECITNWLGMCFGHKCPMLAKKMKKLSKIVPKVDNIKSDNRDQI